MSSLCNYFFFKVINFFSLSILKQTDRRFIIQPHQFHLKTHEFAINDIYTLANILRKILQKRQTYSRLIENKFKNITSDE